MGDKKKRMRTMVVSMWNTENECRWALRDDDEEEEMCWLREGR
jgi:hypothetical protein